LSVRGHAQRHGERRRSSGITQTGC
jgi:hypothetical protein